LETVLPADQGDQTRSDRHGVPNPNNAAGGWKTQMGTGFQPTCTYRAPADWHALAWKGKEKAHDDLEKKRHTPALHYRRGF
jgi:hypothetical protein